MTMWKMKMWAGANIFLLAIICVSLSCSVSASVSYDNKAITINGQRRILLSGSIHYPRSTPEMWPDLIAKAKDSGLDVIQTYVFWNGHEPSPRKYYFKGRYDLIKFIELVQQAGLYVHLRIGPYVCAEWNFGGFPVWLKYVPGIEFRTDNEPFKENMSRFTWKIIDMMKVQKLFHWQGGPIILAQIENEYGPVEWKTGAPGKAYTKWAAQLALDTKAGVPWIMCKQDDAPDPIINTCNGFYCEDFVPNSESKPKMWTENWIGWFTQWGGAFPYRPAEDVAYAVARFIQNGGSYMNYYMFHGGTNFGNTAGLFITTSYDYDAPIDEYGLPREPKYTHLKLLHKAIKMCEPALVSADPTVTKLGDNQEAHVFSSSSGSCAAFLANYNSQWSVNVTYSGMQYELPPWSVSILPDCKREVYNTARVTSPRIYATMTPVSSFSWQSYIDETPTADDDSTFSATGLYEQVNVTRDYSDYLWYMTDVTLGANDLRGRANPILSVVSAGHALHVFVNGQLQGSVYGSLEKPQLSFSQKVPMRVGINKISLLSVAVGLANYGVHFETYNQGVLGPVTLQGLSGEDRDLTGQTWSYKVGMKGEKLGLHTVTGSSTVEWQASQVAQKQSLAWYKTTFNGPAGNDPLALDMSTMGKGQIWVSGQSIGRHWIANPAHGHCRQCNYAGLYNGAKCLSDCGQPSQRWYHVPRAWLQPSGNFLVVFEEWGGDPSGISLVRRTVN